jgi:hypothetical protein
MRRTGLEYRVAHKRLEGNVECIDPHGPALAAMLVLVPGHARGQHHVAGQHSAAFAFDNRDDLIGFEHEAQRVHGMAMRPRPLARHQDLQAHGEIFRRAEVLCTCVRRIVQYEDAPLRVVHGGLPHARVEQRTHGLPAP